MKRITPWIASVLGLLMLLCLLPAPGFAEDLDIVLVDVGVDCLPVEESEDDLIVIAETEDAWQPEELPEPEELRPFSGEYGWLQLKIDWARMEEVGRQRGGQACACYSLAYCRTVLDGEAHDISEFNLGAGEEDAWCSWYDGDYVSYNYISAYDGYERMYSELCKGRPVVILVEGARSPQHYVAVFGFENVVDGAPLCADQFLIFDPCGSGDRLENMGAAGYRLKKLESGTYQIVCDASGASAEREAHRSSYLCLCRFLESRRTLLLRKETELYTLPCLPERSADSQAIRPLVRGDAFLVDALVLNAEGEYWYRGTTPSGEQGYAFAGRFTAGREDFNDLRVEELDAPFRLTPGEAFVPHGVIRASHGLTELSCEIYTGTRTNHSPLMSATLEEELRFCRLEDSELTEALDFASLEPGDYTFVISARCRSCCSADGKTLRELDYRVTLVSLSFSVGEDGFFAG